MPSVFRIYPVASRCWKNTSRNNTRKCSNERKKKTKINGRMIGGITINILPRVALWRLLGKLCVSFNFSAIKPTSFFRFLRNDLFRLFIIFTSFSHGNRCYWITYSFLNILNGAYELKSGSLLWFWLISIRNWSLLFSFTERACVRSN